ncbi:MAG: iron-containing redox enzyme family protein [Jatrophihabitantaceae bacterium]
MTDLLAHADLSTLARTIGPETPPSALEEFQQQVDEIVHSALVDGNTSSELELHRFMYDISAHAILPPWDTHYFDCEHPVVLTAHRKAQDAWLAHDTARVSAGQTVPTEPDSFVAWASAECENHASGVTHPLFAFLAEHASFEQLKHFLGQETPFDIHFGDLVALLMPGVHGEPKLELAGNFWDEMGRGKLAGTHRQLRLSMMERVGLSLDGYLTEVSGFWVEELRLANMYFQTSASRRLAPQSIGMLLATELVVPGRIDRQIDGWRRHGLTDEDMHYLREHVTVDVEHAQGWLDHVVVPLAASRPDLLHEVGIGVLRRLDAALDVCTRAMAELESIG